MYTSWVYYLRWQRRRTLDAAIDAMGTMGLSEEPVSLVAPKWLGYASTLYQVERGWLSLPCLWSPPMQGFLRDNLVRSITQAGTNPLTVTPEHNSPAPTKRAKRPIQGESLLAAKWRRLDGGANVDLHEVREDVLSTEEVIKVSPTTCVECVGTWVVVYDSEFLQPSDSWEVLECVMPKGTACSAVQWSDGQRLQRPLPYHWVEECLNET